VPVLTIGVLALQSSGNTWPHLIANVLPGAVRRSSSWERPGSSP